MTSFTACTNKIILQQRNATCTRGNVAIPSARCVSKPATAIKHSVTCLATAPKSDNGVSNGNGTDLAEKYGPLPVRTGLSSAVTGMKTAPARNKWMSVDLKNKLNSKERTMPIRKTKIVGTIGPSTNSREKLFELLDEGLNVVRLNMSHGDHKSHQEVIDLVNEYNTSGRRMDRVGLLLDTKGPEVRSGDVTDKIQLNPGDVFTFTIDNSRMYDAAKEMKTTVNYDGFVDDVQVNDVLLVDGGMLSLKVVEKTATDVKCMTLDGGLFGSRRHLNVQGRTANLPAITHKDWEDLQFGVDNKVDFFALSFVRDAQVIYEVKEWLAKQGSEIAVLPKIESVDAVINLDEILDACDGAMVARGDLGAELPVEEVPLIQSEIVHKCNILGKPVIVATNMLESMIVNPTPTRAEVADITVAVREGTDAVMLSGETANGNYPIKALQLMSQTAQRVPWELSPGPTTAFGEDHSQREDVGLMPVRQVPELPQLSGGDFPTDKEELFTHLIAYNAANLANTIQVPIILFTRSGFMSSLMSHFRPRCAVYAFTNNETVMRRMSLYRGVTALKLDFSPSRVDTEKEAVDILLNSGQVKRGDKVCILNAGFNTIWRQESTQSIRFVDV